MSHGQTTQRRRIGDLVETTLGPMHVRVDGREEAPAVLLIHGFTSSVHSFDKLTPLLATDYRVIRLDLRGHGFTGGDDDLDPAAQAKGVVEILEHLGATDVAVVGHSFGADVAVAAAAATRRISKVVVIGQAPDYSTAKIPRSGTIMTIPVLGRLLHMAATPRSVRWFGRFAFAPGYDPAHGFDEAIQPVNDHHVTSVAMYREVLIDRRRRLAASPLDEEIAALGLRALVILGRRDQLYPWEPTAARYRAVGVTVVVIENAGHSPNIERPAETADALRSFLVEDRATLARTRDHDSMTGKAGPAE